MATKKDGEAIVLPMRVWGEILKWVEASQFSGQHSPFRFNVEADKENYDVACHDSQADVTRYPSSRKIQDLYRMLDSVETQSSALPKSAGAFEVDDEEERTRILAKIQAADIDRETLDKQKAAIRMALQRTIETADVFTVDLAQVFEHSFVAVVGCRSRKRPKALVYKPVEDRVA